MSMKGVELSSVELGAVMKFLFQQKKAPKETPECLLPTLSDRCSSHSTARNWYDNFQCGDLETEDEARYGRPSTVSTPEIVNHVHDLNLADG